MAKEYWRKSCLQNVDKIDDRANLKSCHQKKWDLFCQMLDFLRIMFESLSYDWISLAFQSKKEVNCCCHFITTTNIKFSSVRINPIKDKLCPNFAYALDQWFSTWVFRHISAMDDTKYWLLLFFVYVYCLGCLRMLFLGR